MIKILIVDDQRLLREALSYILNNDEEFNIVGLVSNGEEAIKACRNLSPDIVLMDIEMPEMNGVSATKVIKEKFPEIKIIMLTTFENENNIMEAFLGGADGYVVKSVNHKDLVLTIKCVSTGLFVVHKSVKNIIIEKFSGMLKFKKEYSELLSEKELEIMKLIAAGKSNKQIAIALNYSEGTIKNNITKILEKLKITDRIQIAIFTIENGII